MSSGGGPFVGACFDLQAFSFLSKTTADVTSPEGGHPLTATHHITLWLLRLSLYMPHGYNSCITGRTGGPSRRTDRVSLRFATAIQEDPSTDVTTSKYAAFLEVNRQLDATEGRPSGMGKEPGIRLH